MGTLIMIDAPTISYKRRIATPRNRLSGAMIVDPFPVAVEEHSTAHAHWFAKVVGEICRLVELRQGWDSNGADPPEPDMILAALELAESLAHFEWAEPSVVTATSSGGIQFEWGRHDASYLELETVSRDTAQYFFSNSGSRFEGEGTLRAGDSLDDLLSYVLRTRQNI
jgi:hypothetical protein